MPLLILDINECTTNDTDAQHNCHEDAICTNLPGAFSCRCKPGYLGDGTYCDGE